MLRHGAWYETHGGHLAFIERTKSKVFGDRLPVKGFLVVGGSEDTYFSTWTQEGYYFPWQFQSEFDIKCRYYGEKPKFHRKRGKNV